MTLTHTFIGNPPGNTDGVLDFSIARTGNVLFAPTVDFPDDPPSRGAAVHAATKPVSRDGSLGIGALRADAQ